ncbi:MAG: hypothetical protein WBW73_21505 [Rhodoplanes sp.]
MTPHPISLTDAQMALIRQASKHIPVEWRDRFLNSLADRLLPHDTLTDDTVAAAAADVLARLFEGAGGCCDK